MNYRQKKKQVAKTLSSIGKARLVEAINVDDDTKVIRKDVINFSYSVICGSRLNEPLVLQFFDKDAKRMGAIYKDRPTPGWYFVDNSVLLTSANRAYRKYTAEDGFYVYYISRHGMYRIKLEKFPIEVHEAEDCKDYIMGHINDLEPVL